MSFSYQTFTLFKIGATDCLIPINTGTPRMTFLRNITPANHSQWTSTSSANPRTVMHERLPSAVQPFLTWLTAQPPGDTDRTDRPPTDFVIIALLQTLFGAALTMAAVNVEPIVAPIGMLLTTAGLGLFQVVVFHHCSHGTVFRSSKTNVVVGRLVSAIILFKHFDRYKQEHMRHHSNNKLLTDEDEFANFVFDTCALKAGVALPVLRQRVLLNLISPWFHIRFLVRRCSAAWGSHDWRHNLIGLATWSGLVVAVAATGQWLALLLAWVIPVTVLLQAATVGRILCEHSFPEPEIILKRGRNLSCHATSGVFPGVMPPVDSSYLAWVGWWGNMLTVQLFVRLVVLVGDAPCHDFHHRKPASRRWTSYIEARHHDKATRSSAYEVDYKEIWGLFSAVDATLASLSKLAPGTLL